MGMDLESKEGRKKYLSDKLDDLLDGINESNGTVLMQELLSWLELTIMDFNNEMQSLCKDLVKKQEERLHLLEMLQSKRASSKTLKHLDESNSSAGSDPSSVLNEWMVYCFCENFKSTQPTGT